MKDIYILGISAFYHDSAASLIKNGEIIAAAQEERFTRKKGDSSFPLNAVKYCLKQTGIKTGRLDHIVFYDKPILTFDRLLASYIHTVPRGLLSFVKAIPLWLRSKLWIEDTVKKELELGKDRDILFAEHHQSHAASAFFPSPFTKAAILTIDGVGEWTTTAIGKGHGNRIELLKKIEFPHSLGLLYSAFTYYCGFRVNSGEYKLMGLAPYGKPRFLNVIKKKLISINKDGSYLLNQKYFKYSYGLKMINRRFEKLFGKPRDPKAEFFTDASGYPSYFEDKPDNYDEIAKQNQYYADIAASIQVVTEQIMVKMANYAYKETGLKHLCMAGGVALNSVANRKILCDTPFEDIYIQPAAGDGGASTGAALYGYHGMLGKPRNFVMEHAYWGEEHSPADTQEFLKENNITYEIIEDDQKLIERVVDSIQNGKVIGWHQGRFEWGPRALGNRSILADPRSKEMKDIVNVKIKFREPFRPFAPSILVDRAGEYFDIEEPERHYPARFMLYVTNVREEKRDILPAITHVDGTGRLQTVRKDTNPKYYKLIETFGDATGVPVLLNTSFNLKGEPVVNTPAEAFSSFSASGMDLLVLGNYLVTKDKG